MLRGLIHHFLPENFLFGAVVMAVAVLVIQYRLDRQRLGYVLIGAVVILLFLLTAYARCDLGGCEP